MIENKVWSNNPNLFVIGADEVGRGSFAGPIVGAAVKINKSHEDLLVEVKDSKKLSEKKRNQIYELISNNNINNNQKSLISSLASLQDKQSSRNGYFLNTLL